MTVNLHEIVGVILAQPGILLALGVALTVVWLAAALISALRRKVK